MQDLNNNSLCNEIKNIIAEQGPITFARYMELALYHPSWGYYTSGDRQIGSAGDFYTSSDVHTLFGQTLARQIVQMWELLDYPDPWYLVEWGPGKGLLARDMLSQLSSEQPVCFAALKYRAVEVSLHLARLQQELLSPLAHHPDQFKWVKPRELWNEAGPEGLTGCIYTNEVVDSFPVHLVCFTPEGLQEIYVGCQDDRLVELNMPLSTPDLAKYFYDAGVVLETGRRAEVNLQAREWLKENARHLSRGFLLTIDYGHESSELFSPHRFNGTLRCFHRHRLIDDPYLEPGNMDITASVDFSALMRWGDEDGLVTAGLTSQSAFLINLDIFDALKGFNDYTFQPDALRVTASIKNLIMPEGMGKAFKVLAQYRGLDAPLLKGFSKSGREPF